MSLAAFAQTSRRPLLPLVGSLLMQLPTAQQFAPQQMIIGPGLSVFTVVSADLDGDGDADVLSAEIGATNIAWYKNTDGLGTFEPQQNIAAASGWACSVFAADLDGDGDQDVLSAALFSSDPSVGVIAWHENTDGLGAFGRQQDIAIRDDGAWSVFAADLDGDGDQDVVSAANDIVWYENTHDRGIFGPQQVITTESDFWVSLSAADLDGDGDQDLISARPPSRAAWTRTAGRSFGSGIGWYENTDSLGTFGPQRMITVAPSSAALVFAADLDGDGDEDILQLTRFHYPDEFSWFANMDGRGAFGPQQSIRTTSDGALIAFDAVAPSRTRLGHWRANLDPDSDVNMLDKIAWFDNTPPPADAVSTYGCGLNPGGSIRVLSGVPSLGSMVVIGLDNPFGTQAVGSTPFLLFAMTPDPNFPCGTPILGFGMRGRGELGELLLISLAASTPIAPILGPPWAGAGIPSPLNVAVPDDLALLGVSIFAQGLLLDPTAAFGVKFGLTDAVELRVRL